MSSKSTDFGKKLKVEIDFYEKLKAWGEATIECDRLDKLAREHPDGWDEELEKQFPDLDKLRGPLYTALNKFAVHYAKSKQA